jgi:predicted outer membrane repeat protein
MLITQRITLLKKVAFVLGIWILAQLAPGYLSTAAASTCPENTSCVTRYDDNVDSDGLNGLNLRQAVGETATSAVFIGATTAVTISLNTPLEIRKDISISAQVNSEGQNLVTIRPSESFDVTPESESLIQIYAESATANVTISNVIVNGTIQDTETVRAIEVIENPIETSTVPLLKIESSTIQNSGAGSDGGAVLTPGDITVSNSTFTSNSAEEYGGAVYAGGEIRVEQSTFTGNTAGDAGGAIATHSSETITVTNSTFQSNEATGISSDIYAGGGAIKGGDGLLQVDGSTFSENISDLDGGAILHFGDIQVTDSVFEENEARFIDYDGYIFNGSGGAIFAVSEDETEILTISIDSSEFHRNKSAGDGGAIRIEGRIEVSQSSFIENEASDDGGAIDIDELEDISGDDTTSRISSSEFRSNDASGGDGGAIDGADYVLIIEESQFLYNYADVDGGAIWSGGLVRVLDSDFSENTADDDGGAIYADSIQINQSLFLENEASDDGGAINVRNNDDQDILSAILNTEFNGNVSMSGQGNALYGNAWLLLNSFVNYRTRGDVSAIALETNFGSVSIGNSFVEQNADVVGDSFCTIGFDYSANNYATDSSCLGSFEANPVKSKVASSSVDSDGYLAFSDDIFNGESGLLAFDSDLDLLKAFIDTARGRLDDSSLGPLPTDDEIAEYESYPALRSVAYNACWDLEIYDSGCFYEANILYQVEENLYLETFGEVNELRVILEDAKDADGHQFIQQYLSVDQNYFDRAVLSTWIAGAVHREPKPVVVSNSNRSVSSINSKSVYSLEERVGRDALAAQEQKLRAEKAALAEAEKKAARSLRLAAVEKRRALTAQMRAKMAQTQMRGEMLKLKKQWQNLMKNFK